MPISIPILKVEIAASPESQQTGLMYRRHLPRNSGMLFDFGHAKPLSFWMANTYLPLQIAFVDQQGRIGQIERMAPHCTRAVASNGSYRYAIETNDGWFDQHRICVGQTVQLPGQAAQPQQPPSAIVLPFKDILEAANQHEGLRLLIEYHDALTVLRTPLEFVDDRDGKYEAVVRAITDGAAVRGDAVTPVVHKPEAPDSRWRSFTIDDITGIFDLQGNPIQSPQQVQQVANSQPRAADDPLPLSASAYFGLHKTAQAAYEYNVRIYLEDNDFTVVAFDGPGPVIGAWRPVQNALAQIKGRFDTADQAVEMANRCVWARTNMSGVPANTEVVTIADFVRRIKGGIPHFIYNIRLMRPSRGSFTLATRMGYADVNPDLPGNRRALYQLIPDLDRKRMNDIREVILGNMKGFRLIGDRPEGKVGIFAVVDSENVPISSAPSAAEALEQAQYAAGHSIASCKIYPQSKDGVWRWIGLTGSGQIAWRSRPGASRPEAKRLMAEINNELPAPEADMEYKKATDGLTYRRCPVCAADATPEPPGKGWEWAGEKDYPHWMDCPKGTPHAVDIEPALTDEQWDFLKQVKPTKPRANLKSLAGNPPSHQEQSANTK